MFLAIILLLASFATASPALDDLPTSWQCHQFEQSVGEVTGVLELVTPLKPAFSAPAVSEVLFSPPFLQNWQLSVVGSGSISLLDGRVLVVDPAGLGGAVILETTAVALEAPMAPSGRRIVVGQPLDLQAIDTTTWDSMPVPVVGEVVRMRFSPGADHLALALLDGAVEVWDIGGTPNRLATLDDALVGAPMGMAFSPSADRLAIAQMDGGVVVLGFEDGNLFNVATTQVPDHTHTSISSGTTDGLEYFAIAYSSGDVVVWDYSGNHLGSYKVPNGGWTTQAVVDPHDGSLFAYSAAGGLLLVQGHRALTARWQESNLVTSAIYQSDMDSVLVGTPEGHVNGWTVGERRMRFSLGGFPGNVVSLWDLGEMGVLAGAIGDDSVANFYLLCSEDLARAFASRSSQES